MRTGSAAIDLSARRHALEPAGAGAILVVESDPGAAQVLLRQLMADGFRAELARTAEHARMRAAHRPPRLVVLGSLDSPRGAVEMLQEIRAPARRGAPWAGETPVIVLGAQASELELRARMRALLRRAERRATPAHRLAVGSLQIDLDAYAVSLYGLPVDLRRMEFELLVHLAGDPERVFTKQELLCAVWGYRSSGSTRTVDSHASRLRRKLQRRGGRWVVNVWGIGYRLI